MVLPAMPGGSPAAGKRQVNVPLARNNDLPYVFLASADSVMHPATTPVLMTAGDNGVEVLRFIGC